MAVTLLRQDEEGVIAALKKEGLRVVSRPMPALMTQAMANLASLGDNNLKMVRRFTRLHFDASLFASLKDMRAVAGSTGLVPQCLSTIVEKRRVDYMLKNVDDVLIHELKSRAPLLSSGIHTIDVVISGDHGKGFYRMLAMILIWESLTSTKPVRVPVEIATIRCTKDTLEVLEAIVPTVNNSLNHLKLCRVLMLPNSEVVLVMPENPLYGGAIPIRLCLAGDLAWISDVLGKRNMSGHWCPYCQANKATMKAANHAQADPWTIARLQEHLLHLEGLPKQPRAQVRKGVVGAPLLTAIPLADLMPPVLHMEIGLINYIINFMELWIHALLDPAPSLELEAARLARLACLRAKDSASEALEAFYGDPFSGGALLALIARQEDLDELLDEQDLEAMSLLKEEQVILQEAIVASEKAFASAKAAERKLSKSFGRLNRPIVLRIEEEIYHAWSIRRPSYHGGDFVGTTCRLLMAQAESVVGSIGDLLVAVPSADRATGVTDEELQQFTAAITRLLQYADAIFGIARKGEREVSQADHINCAQYVSRFCRLWRLIGLSTTIKFHILEDHLLGKLGNGERLEDSTEQQHQISYTFEQRNRIADYKKKARVASRHEAIRNNPRVRAEAQRVLEETSRPKRKEANRQRLDEDRKRKREGRLRLLEMEEITEFPQVDSVLLEQFQANLAIQEEEENV
jgi:hypothetical protein